MPLLSVWLPPLVVAHVLALLLCFACVDFSAAKRWRWWQRMRSCKNAAAVIHKGPTTAQHVGRAPGSSNSGDRCQHSSAVCGWQGSSALLITWHSIGVSVPNSRGGTKRLLQDVSGQLIAGELHALLGPSGAGKSTLLDLVAHPPSAQQLTAESHDAATGSRSQTLVTGSVATCSGLTWQSQACADPPTHRQTTTHHSSPPPTVCFIPQHDMLLPTLTAQETLWWAHEVVAASAGGKPMRHGASQLLSLLSLLGLEHAANIQVGGVLSGGHLLRGLSGGERKRLAIAQALIMAQAAQQAQHKRNTGTAQAQHASSMHTPSYNSHESDIGRGRQADSGSNTSRPLTVLLCDEPTSGLDSTCAMSVVQLLRVLSSQPSHHQTAKSWSGGAALVALHQPKPAIWALFDTVSVLASGRLLYSGPTDTAVTWLTHVTPSWGPYQSMVHGSVPEFLIETVCCGHRPQHQGQQHQSHQADAQTTHEQQVRQTADTFSQLLRVHGLGWWCRAQRTEAADGTHQEIPICGKSEAQANQQGPVCYTQRASDTAEAQAAPHRPQSPASGQASNSGCNRTSSIVLPSTEIVPYLAQSAGSQAVVSTHPSALHPIAITHRPAAPAIGTGGGISSGNTVICHLEHSVAGGRGAAHTRIEVYATVATQGGDIHIHTSTHLTVGDDLTSPRRTDRPSCCTSIPTQQWGKAAGRMRQGLVAVQRRLHRRAVLLATAWRHTVLLTWREWIQTKRGGVATAVKLLLFCWSGLVLGLVFYGLDRHGGFKGVSLRSSALFMSLAVLTSMPYASLVALTADLGHTHREMKSRLYGAVPHLFSKQAATMPLHVVCTFTFITVAAGLQGLGLLDVMTDSHGSSIGGITTSLGTPAGALRVLSRVAQMSGLAVLLVLCSAQVMHLAVVVCPSSDTAFMATTVWAVLNMFFSGFFIDPDQLAIRWLAPVKYISAIRLAFHGMLSAELQGAVLPCGLEDQTSTGLQFLVNLFPEFAATPLPAALRSDVVHLLFPWLAGAGAVLEGGLTVRDPTTAATAAAAGFTAALLGWPGMVAQNATQPMAGTAVTSNTFFALGSQACAVSGSVILGDMHITSDTSSVWLGLSVYYVGLTLATVLALLWQQRRMIGR